MKGTISKELRWLMSKDPHLKVLRGAMDRYNACGKSEDIGFEVGGRKFVIPARKEVEYPVRKRNLLQILLGL